MSFRRKARKKQNWIWNIRFRKSQKNNILIYFNNEKKRGILDILIMCHGKYNQSLVTECDLKNLMNYKFNNAYINLSVSFFKITKGNCLILSLMESFIAVNYGFLNSMTKSMINSLIQWSALELASFGIRINGVAPGITNTNHRVKKI